MLLNDIFWSFWTLNIQTTRKYKYVLLVRAMVIKSKINNLILKSNAYCNLYCMPFIRSAL